MRALAYIELLSCGAFSMTDYTNPTIAKGLDVQVNGFAKTPVHLQTAINPLPKSELQRFSFKIE